MRLSSYIFLLFSIGLIFYFMGYTSPLLYMFNTQGGRAITISCNSDQLSEAEFDECKNKALLNVMLSNLTSDENLRLLLGLSILGLLTTFLGGFGAVYIVPIILALTFLNYVIFPISFIFDPSFPAIIGVPMITLFNLLAIMAVVNFVRGGL